jgi:hypothetical protein
VVPRRALILLAVPALLGAASPSDSPRSTDSSIQVEVSAGHDSNPLLLSEEAPVLPGNPPSAPFTQVGLGARLSHQWNPRAGFFMAADGSGRFHASSLDEADVSRGRVEAGLATVLLSRGAVRLSAALRGSVGAERGTFVDPETGSIYQVEGDPNVLMGIPDRFDVNVSALNVDLRLRTSPRILLQLDASWRREDYVEDYQEIPGLEPLDARGLTLRPGFRWNISDVVRLDVTGEWGRLRYDDLSALEEDGSLAPGTRRRYDSGGVNATLRVTPNERWGFSVGAGASDRQDVHAGYYDTAADAAFGSVSWLPVTGTRLGLRAAQSRYDYERATVDGTANGEKRGGDTLRVTATAERDLNERLVLFGEGGTSRADNPDPLYVYDRRWALAGLRFSL